MAVQGHPRSLILAPIESAYAKARMRLSVVINSNLGRILPLFRDVAGFLLKTAPHPYSTRILGVFPLTRLPMLWLQGGDDRKLIMRVINFELFQPICPGYINVTDGRTDNLQ